MDVSEVLWGMYEEHCSQGRHYEGQRAAVTNLILALAAAMTAVLSFRAFSPEMWPLAALVLVLGLFGTLFSMKHYERFRFHMKCAEEYGNALEKMLPASKITELRKKAKAAHEAQFLLLPPVHLIVFWLSLHLAIAALGAVLLWATLSSAIKI